MSDAIGPALRAVTVPDTAAAWTGAGFTVADDRVQVGPLRIDLDASGDEAVGWRLAVDGIDALDGVPTSASDDAATAPAPVHPNGVTGVDHVVLMTPDLERTVAALGAAGFDERRRRSVPGSDPARTQVFFWAGEVIIELVGPDAPEGDGPARIWGLALVADDLDACKAHLGDRASDPRPAVQPGRRILALRHRDLGLSLPIAVMTPHVR